MKNSKSFRLSVQALSALHYLAEETGANETAIVEIALSHYRKAYNGAKLEKIKEVVGQDVPLAIVEQVAISFPSGKKKRKRH